MRSRLNRRPFEGGAKHKRLRINFSLRGEKSRFIRIALYAVGILIALVLLVYLLKPETQLMHTAEVERITDRGILVVGVRNDMPGYAEDGVGLEVELGRRFADYLLGGSGGAGESSIKYITVTNRTAQTRLTDGSVDVVLALMQRNGSSKFSYSYAYCTDACRVLVKQGGAAVNAPLSELMIGYVQDTVSESILKSYIDAHETKVERSFIDKLLGREKELPEDAVKFTVKAYASYPDMMAALDAGRIDGAAITDAYINKYERDGNGKSDLFMGKYKFLIHETMLGTAEYAIAVSGDEPAIAQLADMFIYELEQSGELDALLSEYGLTKAD